MRELPDIAVNGLTFSGSFPPQQAKAACRGPRSFDLHSLASLSCAAPRMTLFKEPIISGIHITSLRLSVSVVKGRIA